MKKMIFALGLVVALASCGGQTDSQECTKTDSTSACVKDSTLGTVVDSTKVDSTKVDSVKSVKQVESIWGYISTPKYTNKNNTL